MTDYSERINIDFNGNDKLDFYSKSGIFLARGYNRIVDGERGPYIEFERKNFSAKSKLIIPENQSWRCNSRLVYYIEWRACPEYDYIKVYFQKRLVDYADYKIGKFYISCFDLFLREQIPIIEKLKEK